MTVQDLNTSEYNAYYQPYIDQVVEGDMRIALKENQNRISDFFNSIDKNKLSYRYAEGKWSVQEILLHLIDTERVFAYRALCIARQDKTPLPGFDHDIYVVNSQAEHRTIESLLLEYSSVRKATVALFESFDHMALSQVGIASGNKLSVRAIAFIIVGHENHHVQIIKSRYL